MMSKPIRTALPRTGTAVVEFAVVVSIILAPLAVGMMELGRGLMVKQVLSDAARKGCRTAIWSTGTTATVTADINQVLTDNKITTTDATITILVNGTAADPATSVQGDQISVQVSIPVADVAWIIPNFLPKTDIESDTLVMMRQQ